MRRAGLLLACVMATLCTMRTGLGAEGDGQRPLYANNRVVVVFEPDVVVAPVDRDSNTPDAHRFSSPQVPALLTRVGARFMTRLFPDFSHESVNTTSVTGAAVTLPHDLTDVYVITLSDTNVVAAVSALQADRANVRLAEPDYIGWLDYAPNDSLFSQQWWLQNTGQFGGTPGEDINAASAWNIMTGTGAPTRVGIIDSGIDISGSGHPDFGPIEQGPNYVGSGAPDDVNPSSHGTAVSGIVGARGNNREGMAGVHWGVQLVAIKVSEFGSILQTNVASALNWARNSGIRIVNMSFGWTVAPAVLTQAMKNNHTAGMLQVVSMGNEGDNTTKYPARFPYFSETVGAVTSAGNRWLETEIGCGPSGGSNWGDWLDIVAPGGRGIATTRSRATGSYYTVQGACDGFTGTSASAPVVTGVAALVASRQPTLDGEDLAQVLHRTARDRTQYGLGWDAQTGWGVVNADSALKFVSGQKRILRGTASSVYSYGSPTSVQLSIVDAPCVASNNFGSLRYEMRANVTFNPPFAGTPTVWARDAGSVGWTSNNPHSDGVEPLGWAGVVPGSVTPSGCVLYTYIYDVKGALGQHLAWCPTTQGNARMSWTAVGPTGPEPNVGQSYYVPQTVPITTPVEGVAATQKFRVCPNNDGGSSLPDKARIKIVVRDAAGVGIGGIAAADISLLFNGGTPQLPPAGQGFSGVGADSIIANSQYNVSPLCPDVRIIAADGPTDAAGVTYITLTGPGGIRDPNRKWGHYDTEIPVFVYWDKLQGRLTSTDVNGSYVLQIKNFDFFGGLDAQANQGEVVGPDDFNIITNCLNTGCYDWWMDFDSSGMVGPEDFNAFVAHSTHGCGSPNNP